MMRRREWLGMMAGTSLGAQEVLPNGIRLPADWPPRRDELPPASMAMPFSDGIWFDPSDGLFNCCCMGGY